MMNRRATDPRPKARDGEAMGKVMRMTPLRETSGHVAARIYADASFVTHLLAMASDAPQTRQRRRASVDVASAAYSGTSPQGTAGMMRKTI